jgi:phospholipid/cholesterol/gamma-HCH transport system substrate-binding protein
VRRNRKRGLGPVPVAIAVIAFLVLGTWLAFRKELPFRGHWEVDAVVRTANQLRAGSEVRIAGVTVGKVTKIETVGSNEQAARVTLRINEKGRPLHKDATLKIRPRILLEGNFFVDLSPGSPSAPELGDGETIPINQTAGPVQLDQVLGTFEADTRKDLQVLLHELNTAWSNGGAQALNRTIPLWEPAYKNSAIVNDATLGLREHDLSGYLRGAGRVAEGLDRNAGQLQSLIGDLRTTAAAFASRDTQLQDALEELPRTLTAARPALAEVNSALPSLRRFTANLRPGVRSAGPSLDAQVPFLRELRGLVSEPELRGLTADLEPTVPALAALNKATIPLLEQVRAASSCQNEVILPWTLDKIEDKDFPAVGPVYQEQTKPLVGLAGESRTFDANGQWFRVALNAAQFATPAGSNRFLLSDRPILGANPPKPAKRSPLRPDVPCETQERPDLRTNPQAPPSQSFRVSDPPATAELAARTKAVKWLEDEAKKLGQKVKVTDELLTKSELPKLPKVELPAPRNAPPKDGSR